MIGLDAPMVTSPRGVSKDELLELQALAPVLAGHFKRAQADIPPGLHVIFDAGGLSSRHGGVLARLLHTGPIAVGGLARQLGLGLTNASQLIAELDRAGCVQRQTDPADRRRTLVSLRSDVRSDVELLVARRTAPLERAMAQLTVTERAGFLAGLRAWAAQVDG